MQEQVDITGFDPAQHDRMINKFAKTVIQNNKQKAYFAEIEAKATPVEKSLFNIQELKEKFGFQEFRYKRKEQTIVEKTTESVNRFDEIARKAHLVTGAV